VAASLVALMVALPVLYAPMRALIGFRSDTHRSALGWRRVPFIWMGTLIQFGGLAVMPFALLVLGGRGESGAWPAWVGQAGVALAFLAVGAGLHTVQTAGLALATDLAPAHSQPKVVGLMYVMLLLGTIVSAFAFGLALQEFSPGRLVQVIQASAVATLVLNSVSLWKQEPRRPPRGAVPAATSSQASFADAWAAFIEGEGTRRRLAAIALGTAAFAMQDVLLEPYGGQVLGMSVAQTTWLTATLALGGLIGFGLASRVLGRGADAARLSALGSLVGVPAFGAIMAAASGSTALFAAGVLCVGIGGGLFGHATLTLTMNRAPKDQAGLALGAWGAVQATATGVAVAAGGVLRDLVGLLLAGSAAGTSAGSVAAAGPGAGGLYSAPAPAAGYLAVYAIEMALLVATAVVMRRLARGRRPGVAAPAAVRARGAGLHRVWQAVAVASSAHSSTPAQRRSKP
jgi:BCD family chlorophyll transporter-like MFS transporter